jgi:hypothetical protein
MSLPQIARGTLPQHPWDFFVFLADISFSPWGHIHGDENHLQFTSHKVLNLLLKK